MDPWAPRTHLDASAALLPAEQVSHEEPQTHRDGQPLAVSELDEACLPVGDLHDADGRSGHPATPTAPLARVGILLGSAAGSGAESVRDAGHGNDRLPVVLDRFAEDLPDVGTFPESVDGIGDRRSQAAVIRFAVVWCV